MREFIIDTDTASDDAVAILMALAAPDVRVLALTTVAGNVGLEQATRNALYTCEVAGSEVPVYKGAAAPLIRKHEDAHWFHGHDGFGDRGYAAPRRAPERVRARRLRNEERLESRTRRSGARRRNRAGLRLTERRRSRTDLAVGYTTVRILKIRWATRPCRSASSVTS